MDSREIVCLTDTGRSKLIYLSTECNIYTSVSVGAEPST